MDEPVVVVARYVPLAQTEQSAAVEQVVQFVTPHEVQVSGGLVETDRK